MSTGEVATAAAPEYPLKRTPGRYAVEVVYEGDPQWDVRLAEAALRLRGARRRAIVRQRGRRAGDTAVA